MPLMGEEWRVWVRAAVEPKAVRLARLEERDWGSLMDAMDARSDAAGGREPLDGLLVELELELLFAVPLTTMLSLADWLHME